MHLRWYSVNVKGSDSTSQNTHGTTFQSLDLKKTNNYFQQGRVPDVAFASGSLHRRQAGPFQKKPVP